MHLSLILALVPTLACADTSSLALTRVQATHGLFGPIRSEGGFLPGDSLWLEFDIEGISIGGDGKVQYRIELEVADGTGKIFYRQNPTDREALASLGGNSVPGQAHLDIGLDQPAGDYTVKVTVTDRTNKQSQTLTHKVKVLPAAFGLIQVRTTSDAEGTVPAGALGVGQSIWVNFATVRFERDKTKNQPNVQFEMRILDENGKPTLAKPESGVIDRDVAAADKLLGGQFLVSINRSGKFTIEIKATDKVAGKSSTVSLPLNVQARR